MFVSRLRAALGKLCVALLNATLILIALCLFLGWKIFSEANDMTANIARNAIDVAPLRENVTGLTGEISGLRADLSSACEGGVAAPEAFESLNARARDLDAKLARVSETAGKLAQDPGAVMERAISVAVDRLGDEAQVLLNCRSGTGGG